MFMYRLIPVGRLLIIATMLICLAFGQSIFAQDTLPVPDDKVVTPTPEVTSTPIVTPTPPVEVIRLFEHKKMTFNMKLCDKMIIFETSVPLEVVSPAVNQEVANSETVVVSPLILQGQLPPGAYSIQIQKPQNSGSFSAPGNILHNVPTNDMSTELRVIFPSNLINEWQYTGIYEISVIPLAVSIGSPCVKARAYLDIEMIMNVRSFEPSHSVSQVVTGWRSIRR